MSALARLWQHGRVGVSLTAEEVGVASQAGGLD